MFATPDGFPVGADRRTSLEGRANIYVAPSEATPTGATDIRVNIRYIMKVDFRYTAYNKYEQPMGRAGSDSTTVAFDTTRPSESGGDSHACARDRKSTRLNSSHYCAARMTSSA